MLIAPVVLAAMVAVVFCGERERVQVAAAKTVLNAIGPIIIPEFLPREVTANLPTRAT